MGADRSIEEGGHGHRQPWSLLLLLVLLILAVGGCVQRTHTPRVAADWSRGAQIGTSSGTDRPAMALNPAGDRLLMAWSARPSTEAPEAIHLLLLEPTTAEVLAERDLSAAGGDPRSPILAPAGTAGFHLLWLEGPYRQRALYHRRVDGQGSPLTEPAQLSPPGQQVLRAQLSPLPDGGVVVSWISGVDLFLLRLDADGRPQGQPVTRSDVVYADVAVDGAGGLHIAWLERASQVRFPILYARLTEDTLRVSDPYTVTAIVIDDFQLIADDIGGPVLAPAEDGIYLMWWSAYDWVAGGTGEGITGDRLHIPPSRRNVEETSRVLYTRIAADVAEVPRAPLFPFAFPPAYESVDGLAGLTQLAPLAYDSSVAPFPSALGGSQELGALVHEVPLAVAGPQDQVWLAFSLRVRTRSKEQLQPAIAVLQGGEIGGYAVVGWTDRPTIAVSAAADGVGNLYLTWLDITGDVETHPVYLTTNAEEPRRALNRLTAIDLLAILVEIGDRAIRGFVYLLIAAPLLIVPMVWFLIALWMGGGELQGRAGTGVLLVALLLHLGGKYLITRQLLTALPLLGFLPDGMVVLVVYFAPVVTVGLGWGVAWLGYQRRADDPSPVVTYLIAAGVDLFLSLALYGLGSFE